MGQRVNSHFVILKQDVRYLFLSFWFNVGAPFPRQSLTGPSKLCTSILHYASSLHELVISVQKKPLFITVFFCENVFCLRHTLHKVSSFEVKSLFTGDKYSCFGIDRTKTSTTKVAYCSFFACVLASFLTVLLTRLVYVISRIIDASFA